jgi:hypothetical protein
MLSFYLVSDCLISTSQILYQRFLRSYSFSANLHFFNQETILFQNYGLKAGLCYLLLPPPLPDLEEPEDEECDAGCDELCPCDMLLSLRGAE